MDFKGFFREKEKKVENIKRFYKEGVPIISYGKGEFAEHTKEYLQFYNVMVSDAFVDLEYKRDPIDLTLEDCKRKYTYFVILLCVTDASVLERKKKEFEQEEQVKGVFFLGENYPVGVPFMTLEYLRDHKRQLETVYSWLSDDLSRESFAAFIKAKLSGNVSYLTDVAKKSGKEYFHELFGNFDNEIIVDGGAYVGDTYMEAVNAGVSFVKYYAFEPDTENYRRLEKNICEDQKVIPVNKGLYESEKILSFIEKGTVASQFLEGGNNNLGVKTEVTCIDKIAGDATFIKLDVEGAEMSALRGAEATILRNQPKLAVCVYHRLDDMIEIPYKIKAMNDKYQIYFRQHLGNMTRDLLVYALVDDESKI